MEVHWPEREGERETEKNVNQLYNSKGQCDKEPVWAALVQAGFPGDIGLSWTLKNDCFGQASRMVRSRMKGREGREALWLKGHRLSTPPASIYGLCPAAAAKCL